MVNIHAANQRLCSDSRLPRVLLESHARSSWTPALLDSLHAIAVIMAAEDRAHFAKHAYTNDAVHIFREQQGGGIVGFQFWRCLAGDGPGTRVVFGGKLRILPEYRRRALHLVSALVFFDAASRDYPAERLHRMSIASLFGFVSIAGALADYQFVDAAAQPWLCDILAASARESGYSFDRDTGVVDVAIHVTAAQLARYPAVFYDQPLARAYAARNPGYRTNGRYLAFAFDFSPANLAAMQAAVDARLG
jgi:hypothetical protein